MKKTNKSILALTLILSFSITTFAQKYKPDTKETFFGNESNWINYTQSRNTYYNVGIDSSKEMITSWNSATQQWDMTALRLATYKNDGRLLNDILKRYNPTIQSYENQGNTEIEFTETLIDGELIAEETKRTISSWNEMDKVWKVVSLTETELLLGKKKSTINSQSFIGPLKEVQKREYSYQSNVINSIVLSDKENGEWVAKSITLFNYKSGTDLVMDRTEWGYADSEMGDQVNKSLYTYTAFDELDSVKGYTYDVTVEEYILTSVRVHKYDANQNLTELVDYIVDVNGDYQNSYKEVFTYNTASIAMQELNNRVTVYPNPAKDFFYLDKTSLISKITIVDVLGNELAKYDVSEVLNGMDVSTYAKGTYVLTIDYVDGEVGRKKLIVE
jgi:hypothetical protein